MLGQEPGGRRGSQGWIIGVWCQQRRAWRTGRVVGSGVGDGCGVGEGTGLAALACVTRSVGAVALADREEEEQLQSMRY